MWAWRLTLERSVPSWPSQIVAPLLFSLVVVALVLQLRAKFTSKWTLFGALIKTKL